MMTAHFPRPTDVRLLSGRRTRQPLPLSGYDSSDRGTNTEHGMAPSQSYPQLSAAYAYTSGTEVVLDPDRRTCTNTATWPSSETCLGEDYLGSNIVALRCSRLAPHVNLECAHATSQSLRDTPAISPGSLILYRAYYATQYQPKCLISDHVFFRLKVFLLQHLGKLHHLLPAKLHLRTMEDIRCQTQKVGQGCLSLCIRQKITGTSWRQPGWKRWRSVHKARP